MRSCFFCFKIRKQMFFKVSSLKIIFLYLPAKPWAQGSVISCVRVDDAIRLHHQLLQENHWAMNLGSSRCKAFNFTLGKKKIKYFWSPGFWLWMTFWWLFFFGCFFYACECTEWRKNKRKNVRLSWCLRGLDSHGFFVKLCLFGKLRMVTGNVALVTVD